MTFEQLSDIKYLIYLEDTEDGTICKKDETPEEILKEFEKMNREYREIFDRDIITIV